MANGKQVSKSSNPITTGERWVLTATILASSMAFIDSTALNVTLPAIQSDLNARGSDLLWITNGYLLMLASLILIGGSLGDKFGRKKIFATGILIFLLGSLASGLSPSTIFLILARVVQGIGGALMIPGSLSIINSSIAEERKGLAIGTWSAVTTIVTVAGPLLGGFLAQAGLWRLVFLINLPLGVIALFILMRFVPETRDESAGPVDIPGAVLASIALAGLTFGFIAQPDNGFGSPLVFIPLLIGVLFSALFVWVEHRSRYPMMPLHLFENRSFSGTNLLTFFLYGALSASSFFLSLNLIQVQGYSETFAGLAFIPFTILLAVISRFAGKWSDQHGPRRILIAGPTLVGFGFLTMGLVGLTPGPAAYWWTFFPGILLFGVGMGFTVAPLTTTVMSSAPRRYSGTASGINNAVARTAGLLTIAILGALALVQFENRLMTQTASLNLSPQTTQEMRSAAGQLGGMSAPDSVDAAQKNEITQSIKLAFTQTFRTVMLINTALAWLSAAMVFWLVKDKT